MPEFKKIEGQDKHLRRRADELRANIDLTSQEYSHSEPRKKAGSDAFNLTFKIWSNGRKSFSINGYDPFSSFSF